MVHVLVVCFLLLSLFVDSDLEDYSCCYCMLVVLQATTIIFYKQKCQVLRLLGKKPKHLIHKFSGFFWPTRALDIFQSVPVFHTTGGLVNLSALVENQSI